MKTRGSTMVILFTAIVSLIGMLLLLSPGEAEADPGPGVDPGADGAEMIADPVEPDPPANALSPASSSVSGVWEIECVNCPKYFEDMTDRSLRLDEAGNPHVAYGGDHLYHAWHDGSQWHYETVDETSGVGRYASLALDSDGHPHISYFEDKWRWLKYASYDGTAWHIETVDDAKLGDWLGFDPVYTSLALDSGDHPHISYFDATNESVKYAVYDGTTWYSETVDAAGPYRAHPSLALDSGDHPHISYMGKGSLKYAHYDGGSWDIESVDGASGHPSLALDSTDRPAISYCDSGDDELTYTYLDGSDWVTETVDVGSCAYNSLGLDSADDPHIGYRDESDNHLKYAHLDGSGWLTDTVDTGSCGYTSLALDADDQPQMTYFEWNSDDLRRASLDGLEWHTEAVDSSLGVGEYVSLALDGQNDPHMSYHDRAKWNVDYAYQDASGWHSETVEGPGYFGEYGTSLALEATAPYTPHISYCDNEAWYGDMWLGGCRGLRYAQLTASGWQTETVEPGGTTHTAGAYPSLALSPTGQPQIAYIGDDDGESVVKHVALDGDGVWWWSMVDDDDNIWTNPSLALSPNDAPRIAYLDWDWDLRFAYPLTSTWSSHVVDSNGSVGISLAMDDWDHPHISYMDVSNDDLKYAHHDGVSWYTETLDTYIVSNSRDTSLALDSEGNPHISYVGNANLKYAHYDGAAWHFETVDTEGLPGYYLSLALDTDDQPHIAYYDYFGRDLKYAHIPGEHNIYLPLVVRNLSAE